MNITLSKELVIRIISTLKQIDVRGFDSMDKLVGLVMLLENMLGQADQLAAQAAAEAKNGEKEAE